MGREGWARLENPASWWDVKLTSPFKDQIGIVQVQAATKDEALDRAVEEVVLFTARRTKALRPGRRFPIEASELRRRAYRRKLFGIDPVSSPVERAKLEKELEKFIDWLVAINSDDPKVRAKATKG